MAAHGITVINTALKNLAKSHTLNSIQTPGDPQTKGGGDKAIKNNNGEPVKQIPKVEPKNNSGKPSMSSQQESFSIKYSKIPPGNLTKLRGKQGWKDKQGNIWKKDMKHGDHWDVTDPKTGKKIKEKLILMEIKFGQMALRIKIKNEQNKNCTPLHRIRKFYFMEDS